MKRIWPIFLVVGVVSAQPEAPLQKDIAIIAKQGVGTDTGRAAWDRVSQAGPEALPALLDAMDTPSVPTANWFRAAFDNVWQRTQRDKSAKIDTNAFAKVAQDVKRQGRVRRLTLSVLEQQKPGTTAKLLPTWLNDPEFRYDAVEVAINTAKKQIAAGGKAQVADLLPVFVASRDIQQGRVLAGLLSDLKVKVSTAEHLGFLMDWYLIGPFDSQGNKGFQLSYPPEKGVDVNAEVEHQGKKLKWKRYQVQEPPLKLNPKHIALISLREPQALGDADDAVAFAYTEIVVPAARKVEFRGAADDNFTVWVNGEKVFAFEEYRNGVRLDRHRFPVQLQAGKNRVLVKICQTPAPNPEPNWEFLLRVVDETGKGIFLD